MRGVSWFVMMVLGLLVACTSVPEQPKPPVRMQAELAHRNALQAMRDGRIESAADDWRQALQIYQSIDDWNGQGMARLGLAQSLVRLANQQSAHEVLEPMLVGDFFSSPHQAQAAFQMAQLKLADDSVAANNFLQKAKSLCGESCRLALPILNLEAKIALNKGDLAQAALLANQAVAMAINNKAELAFSQRILAGVALEQYQYDVALVWLERAIVLDRQSAEPLWLLDDYRLMQKIAMQSSNVELLSRAQGHLSSLCAALACTP